MWGGGADFSNSHPATRAVSDGVPASLNLDFLPTRVPCPRLGKSIMGPTLSAVPTGVLLTGPTAVPLAQPCVTPSCVPSPGQSGFAPFIRHHPASSTAGRGPRSSLTTALSSRLSPVSKDVGSGSGTPNADSAETRRRTPARMTRRTDMGMSGV